MITTRIHLLNVLPGLLFYVAVFSIGTTVALVMVITGDNMDIQFAVIVLTMLFGALFIRTYLAWQAHIVIVTPQAITIQRGILFRRRDYIALHIATIHVDESLADRAVNRGSLCVTAANGEQYTIGPIGAFRQVCGVLGM